MMPLYSNMQGDDGLAGQKGPPGSQGPFVSNVVSSMNYTEIANL